MKRFAAPEGVIFAAPCGDIASRLSQKIAPNRGFSALKLGQAEAAALQIPDRTGTCRKVDSQKAR